MQLHVVKPSGDMADLHPQPHWQEKWRLRTGTRTHTHTHAGIRGCSCATRGQCARLELQCVFFSKAHLKRRLERFEDSGMSWDYEGLCGITKGYKCVCAVFSRGRRIGLIWWERGTFQWALPPSRPVGLNTVRTFHSIITGDTFPFAIVQQ